MEEQRFPLSVRLIGVMHKEKSKMFMTSVLWSDQNEIVVYRTFGDFVNMHKKLKKVFPPASKLKKSDRVLPKFRAQKIKRQGKKKGPTKSLARLKSLQNYCNELLSCDARVAQSADVIQFFHPIDQDLQPEFSKNSVMIMPSEDEVQAKVGGGNVTQPFVTETYRCVAPYETKDTKNKPFKVALDEKVDVLIKDKAGWWLVETEDKRMAWFPAPYLEKMEDDIDDDDDDELDGPYDRGMLYCAIKSYKATKDDEITVSIGTVVEILQKSDNGWWLIRYSGKTGYIPTMYLQPYNYPQIRMTAHKQDKRPSSPFPLSGLEHQQRQFSHSQGNLLLLSPVRSSSPQPLQLESRQRSHSLNTLSDQLPPPPARITTPNPPPADRAAITPTTPTYPPPPAIMVQMDGEEAQGGKSWRDESQESFSSDSTDFSFSDDLSSSSASSIMNLSPTKNDDQMRLSRTPPPPSNNRLSPTTANEGRLMPSISDPSLYKGPTSPKVPPRPQAQEILQRCTTVTRKNAARGGGSPTSPEILSR